MGKSPGRASGPPSPYVTTHEDDDEMLTVFAKLTRLSSICAVASTRKNGHFAITPLSGAGRGSGSMSRRSRCSRVRHRDAALGLPPGIDAIPIEDAVGGVAVLLDLKTIKPAPSAHARPLGTNMDSPLHLDAVEHVRTGAVFRCFDEGVLGRLF